MSHEELAASLCGNLGREIAKLIASAREEATAAERERCAKIVEGGDVPTKNEYGWNGEDELVGSSPDFKAWADLIRSGDS